MFGRVCTDFVQIWYGYRYSWTMHFDTSLSAFWFYSVWPQPFKVTGMQEIENFCTHHFTPFHTILMEFGMLLTLNVLMKFIIIHNYHLVRWLYKNQQPYLGDFGDGGWQLYSGLEFKRLQTLSFKLGVMVGTFVLYVLIIVKCHWLPTTVTISRENEVFWSNFLQLPRSIWIKLSALLQPVGLLKLITNLFSIWNIPGREPYQRNLMKNVFNVGSRSGIQEPTSSNDGGIVDTTDIYSLILVLITLYFI